MQFDWKHILALVLGAGLSLGLGALSKAGIPVQCPAAQSAPAQSGQ